MIVGALQVKDMGPPTSIGESALFDVAGLFAEFCGVRTPGDGDPALIDPDWETD